MDKKEESFLLFYMGQTWDEMRHLENLRERVSVLILSIASIISGFIVHQKFAHETLIMVWFVIMLGVVGLVMSVKIFQIHQMGQKRLDKWNTYFESHCGDSPKILKLRNEADCENKKDFKIISKIPHNFFWTVINIFIIGIGILMMTMIKPLPDIEKNTISIENLKQSKEKNIHVVKKIDHENIRIIKPEKK